jgi:hypothetical protein
MEPSLLSTLTTTYWPTDQSGQTIILQCYAFTLIMIIYFYMASTQEILEFLEVHNTQNNWSLKQCSFID